MHCAWIENVECELKLLHAGRDRLKSDIAKAERAKTDLEALIARDAATLVDKVRAGVEWTLSAFGGVDVMDADAKLAGARHQCAIAERALGSMQVEIAQTEKRLETLCSRKSKFVSRVLHETAEGIREDYQIAIDLVRDRMTQLEALERHLGDGRARCIAVVPSFVGPVDEVAVAAIETEIKDARKSWEAFARAVAEDPRAPADLLEFAEHDPQAKDDLTYDKLHPIERRIVDIEFAKGL